VSLTDVTSHRLKQHDKASEGLFILCALRLVSLLAAILRSHTSETFGHM